MFRGGSFAGILAGRWDFAGCAWGLPIGEGPSVGVGFLTGGGTPHPAFASLTSALSRKGRGVVGGRGFATGSVD